MPKSAVPDVVKVRKIVKKYPEEFLETPSHTLFCRLCGKTVKHDKEFHVDSHRGTAKHQRAMESLTASSTSQNQTFLPTTKNKSEFAEDLVIAFTSANIPLYKLRHPRIQDLFAKIGHPLPSESTCREKVSEVCQKEQQRIIQILTGKNLFAGVDECEVHGKKFVHFLVGDLEYPSKSYLLICEEVVVSVSAQLITHVVDDALHLLGCDRLKFNLLVTDAAPSMVAAARTLKELYPHLVHITCIAHLLHNVAMKVRAYFPNIDALISAVKAATVKNKERRQDFALRNLPSPPEPVITRWVTWLEAALYYADHLPIVREIVEGWPSRGLLVDKCKTSILDSNLPRDLMAVKMNYKSLVHLTKKVQDPTFSLSDALSLLDEFNNSLTTDPCRAKHYLEKRLKTHEMNHVLEMRRPEISPSLYEMLHRASPTTTSVERSFSMLGKFLKNRDRHFLAKNLQNYMMMYFNNSH